MANYIAVEGLAVPLKAVVVVVLLLLLLLLLLVLVLPLLLLRSLRRPEQWWE